MRSIKLFLFGFLIVSSVSAQKLSIGIAGGYGYPVFIEEINMDDPINTTVQKNLKKSFGQGSNYYCNIEYNFLKHISGSFSLGLHSGTPIKSVSSYSYGADVGSDYYTGVSHGEWSNISQFQFIPEIKFLAGHKLKIYWKLGFVLGVGSKMTESYTGYDSIVKTTLTGGGTVFINSKEGFIRSKQVSYTKGVTGGITSGIGLSYLVYKNLSLFTEGSLVYMEWSHGNKNITETVNSTTSISKVTTFKNKPYSSINVLVGVKWAFVKQAAKLVEPAF